MALASPFPVLCSGLFYLDVYESVLGLDLLSGLVVWVWTMPPIDLAWCPFLLTPPPF